VQNNTYITQDEYDIYKQNLEITLRTSLREKKLVPTEPKRRLYFAGGMFTNKDLIGNMFLAASIDKMSNGRYQCILPQDLPQVGTTAEGIKDSDLTNVRDTDGI